MKKIVIKTEIYSRVSGYFRPVNQWNKGKQSEFNDRRTLELSNKINNPAYDCLMKLPNHHQDKC